MCLNHLSFWKITQTNFSEGLKLFFFVENLPFVELSSFFWVEPVSQALQMKTIPTAWCKRLQSFTKVSDERCWVSTTCDSFLDHQKDLLWSFAATVGLSLIFLFQLESAPPFFILCALVNVVLYLFLRFRKCCRGKWCTLLCYISSEVMDVLVFLSL